MLSEKNYFRILLGLLQVFNHLYETELKLIYFQTYQLYDKYHY